jgi:hypothetical protein
MAAAQKCELCGAAGDGIEGWAEDHIIVCVDAMIACPLRAYGCSETFQRFQVSRHLPVCPASAVLCCYSQLPSFLFRPYRRVLQERMPHVQLQERMPHVQMVWPSGGHPREQLNTTSSCCSRPLRRCDHELHFKFAHADPNMVGAGCPFHNSNRQSANWNEETAPDDASPQAGTQFRDRDENAGNVSESRSCAFRCRPTVPQFCLTSKQHATIAKGSTAGETAQSVFSKTDVFARILESVPIGMLPMLCCTAKAIAEACNDPSLNSRRKLLSLQWEKVEIMDSETRKTAPVWRKTSVWVAPEIPVPLCKWVRNMKGDGLLQHMRTCTSLGEQGMCGVGGEGCRCNVARACQRLQFPTDNCLSHGEQQRWKS